MTIEDFKNRQIHIVGVSGSEGSAIFSFFLKHGISSITVHDFTNPQDLEKNFKLWHKGVAERKKEELWQTFSKNIKKYKYNFGADYLKDIEKASVIFIPQSWRLYEINKKLSNIQKNTNIPFYSLTRLYLEYSKAKKIAVTGTVGKGSVANLLVQILKISLPKERTVYFGGNETWMVQVADKLDDMKETDILVLEVSHRQLLDGVSISPDIVIITNIYPNHLDEISWEKYRELKLLLLRAQGERGIGILNYDNENIRNSIKDLKSKIFYFSEENHKMNTKNIQNMYSSILSTYTNQFPINILAASTAADVLGIDRQKIKDSLSGVTSLQARMQYITSISGINFYDDIKSTTPWATIKAIEKLKQNIILICGGNTKGIDYSEFIKVVKTSVRDVIVVKSELSELMKKERLDSFKETDNLKEAVVSAYATARKDDNILISPAAGFFYSQFIAKKLSLRKIITSLPPKEIV